MKIISSSMMMMILFLLFFVTIQFLPVTTITPDKNGCENFHKDEMDYYAFVQHWPGTRGDIGGGTDQPSTSSGCLRGSALKGGSKSKIRNQQQTSTGGKKYNARKDQKKPEFILRPGHVEDFGIHGLWPQYIKNQYYLPDPVNRECYPEYCPMKKDDDQPQASVKAVVQEGSKAKVDEKAKQVKLYQVYVPKEIEHLNTKDDLKKHWHSMASPKVDGSTPEPEKIFGKESKSQIKPGIWEHEWEKHGTCSLMNQKEYFETSLRLKKQNNLLEALVHANIVPDGTTYSSELIMNAIKNEISNEKEVRIDCNEKNELYQIHICYTKGEMELMDCPGNSIDVHCTDPQEIIFPKFPSESKKDEL